MIWWRCWSHSRAPNCSAESEQSAVAIIRRAAAFGCQPDTGYEQIDPLRSEFIKYIVSKDGQTQTEMAGDYPITNTIRKEDLKRLGILTDTN